MVMTNGYAAGSANKVVLDPLDPRVKVLYSFTNELRMPFIAGAGLDLVVVQALKNALLLQRSPSVLTKVDPSLTRFIEVKDSDYDGLRKEMDKATRFGEVEN